MRPRNSLHALRLFFGPFMPRIFRKVWLGVVDECAKRGLAKNFPICEVYGMNYDALRSELGLKTLSDLADKLGISPSHLSMLKSGEREMSIGLAAKIEHLTGRDGLVEAVVDRKRESWGATR